MTLRNHRLLMGLLLLTLLTGGFGCGARRPAVLPPAPEPEQIRPAPAALLKNLGYSIQVGAFSNPSNAARLAALLESRGIDAYSFLHESGLYKVRFGDYRTYAAARKEAEALQKQKMIGEFFIVRPEDNAAERIRRTGKGDLREELVATARRFLGAPYLWGGANAQDGFDCSGLVMVAYRLNGLKLPRTSRDQFCAGQPMEKDKLRKGDLVFFDTKGRNAVSHVGLYVGNGKFIHAPRRGKNVSIASLNEEYYQKRYMGARSYL